MTVIGTPENLTNAQWFNLMNILLDDDDTVWVPAAPGGNISVRKGGRIYTIHNNGNFEVTPDEESSVVDV